MFAKCSGMNLWLCELPQTSAVDSSVSCDRSLACEFPLSPSSQLMYESEPLQDQCCVAVHDQQDQTQLETGVISPSVEGLIFTDNDVFQYTFANDEQPAAAAASVSSSDDAVSSTAVKYWTDAWKMTESAAGPTLTQLNSEDLDTTLLDDFGVSSSVDCTQQQQLTCESNITTSVSSTGATLPCWAEQMRDLPRGSAVKHQQQHEVMSHHQHVESVQQRCAQTHFSHTPASTSHSAAETQLSLDHYWEAIESFLKSEDARMAAEASNHQQQMMQLAADIKTEAQGILICVHLTVT